MVRIRPARGMIAEFARIPPCAWPEQERPGKPFDIPPLDAAPPSRHRLGGFRPFSGRSIDAILVHDHAEATVPGLPACGLLRAGLVRNGPRAEPDPKTYWDVKDIRPGMKGVGRTVMVGTKLEEFEAEVLGVMRDVSPGRDMVLCRLNGCKLEHSGIIQGMSGSPIYIDGKLLGAVAFAWEFAKDPIAGVTPF